MHDTIRIGDPAARFVRALPNLVTLLSLFAGLTSIRLSMEGHSEAAAVAIIIAGVCDGLDGRVARLLKNSSDFGAQLDSLADCVNFGVAPAFLLYNWNLYEFSGLGWALAALFAMACALRLARFNTQLQEARPAYARDFFTGVPAPAGAGLVMIPMFLSFEFGADEFSSPYLSGAVLALVAALMVSRMPTFSFKSIGDHRLHILLLLLLVVAGLTVQPWATLLAIGAVYLASFPLSLRAYRRLQKAG